MEDYPSMIEPGKRCYCESRGEVVYVDRDSTGRHPAVAKLPRHESNLTTYSQSSNIFVGSYYNLTKFLFLKPSNLLRNHLLTNQVRSPRMM